MNYYRVGTIVAMQGLQGEVRVNPTTDFGGERFAKGALLSLFDKKDLLVRELTVKSGKKMKNLYIVSFEGLNHINEVEKFRDFTLKVSEENQKSLEAGSFYYHEIIGLVVYEGSEKIGTISEILQPGANDVWVVKRQGKTDLLLPYIPSVVLQVDLQAQRVLVEIPEGLD